MDIVGNDNPPAEFRRVAYFEAFNVDRPCLNMDVSEIPTTTGLTHIHFAFAGITSDFQVKLDDNVKEQFNKFVKLDVPWKKIVSFGGWAESTDADSFQLYKDAVKPANRDKFANAVVAFAQENGLDGVDFDWEYPGATDIPGVPAGWSEEAVDYLKFLTIVKSRLGDKSLSIALPASYWYLKPFPVEKMAKQLDYFIYMTYDLHGQWDYGNQYSNPGCPFGNCLRSHVNKTETYNALSMVTKAGVPASKVIVGVSSFARSFGMKDTSCTGPLCEFTGSFTESTAEPGLCTGTGGYISNAELDQISRNADLDMPGYEVKKWYDKDSDSDIMVYGTHGEITTWAAYMSDETKAGRTDWIEGLNLGGTTDWAIDLADWHDGPSGDDDEAFENLPDMECDSSLWPVNLTDLEANIDKIPAVCRSMAIVNILLQQLDGAITAYKEASDSFDNMFKYYVDWAKEGINPSLEKFMMGNGTKYMDCEWSSLQGSGSGPCDQQNLVGNVPARQQGIVYISYTMRDEDGFYKALLADYGIEKDWIKWVDHHSYVFPCPCPGGVPTDCADCQMSSGFEWSNYPRKVDDDSKIDVANPKSVVDAAIPNTDDLAYVMLDTYLRMRVGALDAEDVDVATAFSIAVFMLQDTAAQMETIKEIGADVKEAKKRELIMNILIIVFAVIPFAGEAAAALGGASLIARGALIIGEAGNIALSIVDIVDNPASAPFAILGVLGSAAAVRAAGGTRKAFSEAAAARRALDADQIKLFGSEFVRKDRLVQNILKTCGM